jgi:hypothetical protein
MTEDLHYRNFEKECFVHEVLGIFHERYPKIKIWDVNKMIDTVDPDFSKGLFEIRPCKRILRYIGDACAPSDEEEKHFIIGKTYTSIDFNGGTYRIEGYARNQRIGFAYFEVVEDLDAK